MSSDTDKIRQIRPGIRRVAREAGVSVSTVSRALNGYSDVNAQTRERIAQVARDIGYQPDHAASMLQRTTTKSVTFVVSQPWTKYVDPFFLGLLDGLELALTSQGYDLQVVMARDMERESEVIHRIVERNRSDAVIFARTRPQDDRIDWLEERGIPFVTVGQTERNSHCFVDRDQLQVGRGSVERLAALGHRKIAHLTTPTAYTYTQNTIRGVREGLANCGLSLDPELEVECTFGGRTGADAITQILARGAQPTALICGNDVIAISALEALRSLGIEPGHDIALIGCDDSPLSSHVRPALTTFSQDLDAIGMRLGRIALARLGGDLSIQQDIIEPRLIIRESDCVVPVAR